MASALDRSQENEVAKQLLELMDELGYTPEEFIPGLMVAAYELAERTEDPDLVVDLAIAVLEDGPVEDDDE